MHNRGPARGHRASGRNAEISLSNRSFFKGGRGGGLFPELFSRHRRHQFFFVFFTPIKRTVKAPRQEGVENSSKIICPLGPLLETTAKTGLPRDGSFTNPIQYRSTSAPRPQAADPGGVITSGEEGLLWLCRCRRIVVIVGRGRQTWKMESRAWIYEGHES